MIGRNAELRKELLRKWKSGCVFCGYNRCNSNGHSLLEAAHIKSFSDNYGNDLLSNIIMLCRNHHAEYDEGMIDFDTEGTIYCIDKTDPLNGKKVHDYPTYVTPGFIAYHNQESEVGRKYIPRRIQLK